MGVINSGTLSTSGHTVHINTYINPESLFLTLVVYIWEYSFRNDLQYLEFYVQYNQEKRKTYQAKESYHMIMKNMKKILREG
jgi:hypothetical protein